MGQKSLLMLLYFLVIHGAEAMLVLEAPAEAVQVGENATYRCSTSVEGNEVKWKVEPPDGKIYDETSERIEELETMWNIYRVPRPSDRDGDQFHNNTLVAMATEENNNTIITCEEIDPFDFFPTDSKTEKLITIGTTGGSGEAPSTEGPTRKDPTQCLDPDDIVNGMVILTGNAINDTASYTCDSGFELIGDVTVTCTQVDVNSATFSPTPPVCSPMLVLEAPAEAVPVGRNATYQCSTPVEENEVKWAVQTPDGSYYDETDLTLIEELETMWKIYFVPHPSDRVGNQFYNITLVAGATEENNNTNITCNEIDPITVIPLASTSEILITIGPPLAPGPTVEARNDTAVQVSWKEPFIWEGYTIDSYFITVENTSSGEVQHETVNTTSIIIYDEGIAVTCAIFNVSARSILGSSKPGVVTSGFPIGPFNDTAVNIEVAFKQTDLKPKLEVEFELPSACNFEMANYTIFIWENGSESEGLTFGPNKYFYTNRRSVTREIPFNSSEPDLARDTEYLMIIEVTSSAGNSTSGAISFCTVASSGEDSIGIVGIVGIAVGTSIVAIFVLCLLMVVATAVVQRKKKRRVVVNVREMVDNPIYVGDEEEEEKYENIEGYQPTFITGLIGAAPYAVTGPPPALPEPRKGKECENLAEDGTRSADRLSKVSAGDEQNVYVKSEC